MSLLTWPLVCTLGNHGKGIACLRILQVAGLKNFLPPEKYTGMEIPDRPKLKFFDKVPQYPTNVRPPKMMKCLRFMRGPELVNNKLIHNQFGIMALGGGRLRWGHFEMIRLTIGRNIDTSRMFAVWRVDAPWQPVTKKGQGQRMGGGKGAIDHYVTPVKAGRIIVEVAGRCEFAEVKGFLHQIAQKLPFKAEAVSEETIQKAREEEERLERENMNPYTFKYIVQNNMGGCHRWISPYDKVWFGKYR
ncbi:39S ribosomal protein L16, mitochondrial [Ischnura elegans]|uniref:39S ribosomal protein L16, mitochondrial n=1 Tax=Ischnura elegans TaxID=197161 RepID=UPI001ED895E4|nr:39S ribosomal protein L16, mitochondrial [Ischnura elegans]